MSEVQEINVGGSVFDVKDKSAMTLALNNKVGAKNFIAYPYHTSTTTVLGVTFTVNSDGTVGVNGTATALTGIALMYNKTIKAGKYILSSGIANENVWVRIYKNESPYTVYAKTGLNEVEFEFNEDMDKLVIAIGVDDGYTASGIVVKPMLRLAEDTDTTYQPYAMTNRDLTEFAINKMGRQLPLVNLGTEYTAELKADISSGKFEKAVVGGYLTINGHVYYLAHPDYWLHTGDTECTTHHMLVIPDKSLYNGVMNDSDVVTGGYYGSKMKTSGLANALATVKADFGADHVLAHRQLFTNAVANGAASGWAWYDSQIDLMNESMVYGHEAWSSAPGYDTGIDKTQLALFQARPDLITNRENWWLRDVVSAPRFARVADDGTTTNASASAFLGVRPAFAIIGD